jgi:hypothetical protein
VKTTSRLLFKALWSSRGSNNSVATTSVPHPFTTMNNKERKKERRNKPRYREITLESSRPAGLEKNDSKMFLIQSNLEQPQQHHNTCTRIRLEERTSKEEEEENKRKLGQENNKVGSSERGRTGRLGNGLWLDLVLVLVLEELWCLLVGW